MEKKFDVIGFGDPFQDLDIQLSRLPETNVNMRMNDYCFMGGGNVPTAMVAAARRAEKLHPRRRWRRYAGAACRGGFYL